jgi:hypothetical protein
MAHESLPEEAYHVAHAFATRHTKPCMRQAKRSPGSYDVGQAVLDRITALPRTWLTGDQPIAKLHPDRHTEVSRPFCNLIGP